MKHVLAAQLHEDLRRLISPEAAARLTAGPENCPACGKELVYRGVAGGRPVWECLAERQVWLERGVLSPITSPAPEPPAAAPRQKPPAAAPRQKPPAARRRTQETDHAR